MNVHNKISNGVSLITDEFLMSFHHLFADAREIQGRFQRLEKVIQGKT